MYKAVGSSLIVPTLVELVTKSLYKDWVKYYNFQALPVPIHILMDDPILSRLSQRHTFHAGILKMPERTCYNWHSDTDRKVSINMMLHHTKSECLFLEGDPGVVFNFYELKYAPATYYAFNTQIPHMVLNHVGNRYMFSVEFLGESRDLTFDELCAEL